MLSLQERQAHQSKESVNRKARKGRKVSEIEAADELAWTRSMSKKRIKEEGSEGGVVDGGESD